MQTEHKDNVPRIHPPSQKDWKVTGGRVLLRQQQNIHRLRGLICRLIAELLYSSQILYFTSTHFHISEKLDNGQQSSHTRIITENWLISH